MTNGKRTPAAAPPTVEQFRATLREYRSARDTFLQARSAHEAAQVRQADAINALPEDQRADLAQLEAIGDRLRITALGDDAFGTMQAAGAALEALMAVPAGTPLELFEKMNAAFCAPFEAGDHTARLLADAGRVTLLFGSVWLERWTALGGTVAADPNKPGKMYLGRNVDGDAGWLGRIMELEALLEAMPDGRASVRALVEAEPRLGLGKAVRA